MLCWKSRSGKFFPFQLNDHKLNLWIKTKVVKQPTRLPCDVKISTVSPLHPSIYVSDAFPPLQHSWELPDLYRQNISLHASPKAILSCYSQFKTHCIISTNFIFQDIKWTAIEIFTRQDKTQIRLQTIQKNLRVRNFKSKTRLAHRCNRVRLEPAALWQDKTFFFN